MTRIFLSLAVLSLVALAANLLVGLNTGDFQGMVKDAVEAQREARKLQGAKGDKAAAKEAEMRMYVLKDQLKPFQTWVGLHLFLGVFAALLTLLVNSVAITYFIGTSRWCKEVVDAYHLDPAWEEEGQRIKRGSFAWSLLGIATIITIVALGAASDPRTWNAERSGSFVLPHYLAAFIGILVIAFCYWQQWNKMSANFDLVDRVMEKVREIKSVGAAIDPAEANP